MGIIMQTLILNNYFIPETYRWDEGKQIWKYKNDKQVNQIKIDKLYQKIYDKLQDKNNLLTEKLIKKEITINKWKSEFYKNIKFAEINTFLLKTGGAENISNKDIKVLNNNLKKKFSYFNKFVQDIKNGVSEKELKYRAGRYNKSIGSALSSGNLLNKKKTGFNYAYRILGASEHCRDCIFYFSLGVVPIDEFTPIRTNCICQEKCKCSELFFVSLEDAIKSHSNVLI
jgi:hypothetical protein